MELTQEQKETLRSKALNPAYMGMLFNAVVNNYDTMDDAAIEEVVLLSLRVEEVVKRMAK